MGNTSTPGQVGSAGLPPRSSESDGVRALLSELSKACPFHQSNPEECPLFPLRKMQPAERQEWLDALRDVDLSYLVNYHHVCLGIKLGSPPAQNPHGWGAD